MTTLSTTASVEPRHDPQPVSEARRILERHRRIWARKAVLREVYTHYFREMLSRTSDHRPIVELGSGPGFLKEFAPEIISTDVEPLPWIDRVVDGCRLPFNGGSIGNLVMMDVFHHLPHPLAFLAEASRVLQPGGRLVMLEPWTSLLGYPFYRYVHHEGADRHVDPARPFDDHKGAMDGNAALPRLVFERWEQVQASAPTLDRVTPCRNESRMANGPPCRPPDAESFPRDLRLISLERLPAISYLLTGGFKPVCLLPRPLLPLMRRVDRLAAPLAKLIALRAMIVLEKERSL